MSQPEPLALHLAPGVRAAFTTRAGGGSAAPYDALNLGLHVGDDSETVLRNREASALSLGLDAHRVTWAEQVHGAGTALVTAAHAGRGAVALRDAVPGCDAMVTTEAGLPLAALVADCVPLLLADRDGGPVAAVHAGRRGILAGVVSSAVALMVAHGAHADRVAAAAGPSIGACCYEVGDDMHDDAVAALPALRATSAAGRPALDLAAGVDASLEAAGAAPAARYGGCTACEPDLWFSYRRDGVTGRTAGIVWRDARG